MLFVLFFVFLSSLKSIFAFQNNNNIYNSIISNIISEEPKEPSDCFNYLDMFNFNNSDIIGFSKCFLNFSKYDTEGTKSIISFILTLGHLDNVQKYIINDKKLGIIFKIFNDSMYNGLIDEMLDLFKNHTIVVDSIINLLNEYKNEKGLNYSVIRRAFTNIFEVDEAYNFLIDLYEASEDDLFKFLSSILSNFKEISRVYQLFMNNIKETDTRLLFFDTAIDIIKVYDNVSKVIEVAVEFLINYQYLIPNIEKIMVSDDMKYVYENILVFRGLKNTFKEVILGKSDYIHLFFELCQDWTILKEGADLLVHSEDDRYLIDNIPSLLYKINDFNKSYIDQLSNIFLDLAYKITKDEKLFTDSSKALIKTATYFYKHSGLNSSLNVSSDCEDLFTIIFLNLTVETRNLFSLFVEKFFMDSSINKGDLLTYDNCLMLGDEFRNNSNYSYLIYPSYVISFINNPIKSRYYKNTSYFLKTNYIISICLPFGFKNETQKENNIPMCTDEDYNNVVKFLFDIVDDINNVTIKSFTLHENNIKASSIDKLYGIIGIIILLLPLIIVIILAISKKILINRQKKQNSNNELIEENNKNNVYKKVKFPNWYIYLNELFNIFQNGKELF